MTTTRSPHNAGQTVTVQQISPMPVKDMDWGPITVRENWGRLFISWKDQEIIAVMQHYPALIEALQHFVEPATPATEPQGLAHIVDYTNWRGETARRVIRPIHMWWGKTEWHPDEQWMLTAWDCEKDAVRDFAWQDMRPVQNPATTAAARPAPQPAAEHEYPDPLIAEDRYEDEQPAADTRVTDAVLREAIGRAWCHEENVAKEMDVDLAEAVLWEIHAIIGTAQSDKIAEAARDKWIEMAGQIAAKALRYEVDNPGAHPLNITGIFRDALRALAGKVAK